MNLSEPAVLLTALFFLIAGLAAGLIGAKVRSRRTRLAPTLLADPTIRAVLDTCEDLIAQFDQALSRHIDGVADGGHDEGALALLGVLDRAGITADELDQLRDTLAWLAVCADLHDDDRRGRGLQRLASRLSRTAVERHEPSADVTE